MPWVLAVGFLILLAAWWLRPLQLHPALETPLLVAATAAGCVGGYLVARRLGPLRVWFGLGSTPRSARPLTSDVRPPAAA